MYARRMWSSLASAACVAAACISTAAPAAAAPVWNGRYKVVTMASEKAGSSIAVAQAEPDFSAQIDFVTDCSRGQCVATATNGPAPSNPTVPQPQQYGWDGSRWLSVYTWQWECFLGDGAPREYAPARSQVFYRPDIDGTMYGTWRTDILSGPCRGNVIMPVAAYPA